MSLVVKCSDGIIVHVDKDIITKFSIGFQKKLAECESEASPVIIIDNVNSRSLLKVVEYCTVHNDPSIAVADLKTWDNKFVKVEPSVLCELASAAYHLEIKPMVDLTCYAIAQLLKGNTPEEIRRIFNIIYDFGPDDDVPPPTIRDKLRNRWIRKTNGKRTSSGPPAEYTNPLVHALAIQNTLPAPSSPSSPLPLLPSSTTTHLPEPTPYTSDDAASAVDGVLSPSHTPTITPQAISDTRTVEELLSFINSDEQKTKHTTKSKKAKKKKKRAEVSTSHTYAPNSTTTATQSHVATRSDSTPYGVEDKKEKKAMKNNKSQHPTNQPAKDNDKKQRSRKNNATSHSHGTSSPLSPSSTPSASTNHHKSNKINSNNKSNNNNSCGKKKSLLEKLSDSSPSGSESSETNENPEEPVAEEEEYDEEAEGDVGEEEVEADTEADGEEGEGEVDVDVDVDEYEKNETEEDGEEGQEEEGEEGEDDDGDVDREVEEFRLRLEAAKETATGPRIALPSALSIALSVLGPKK